MQLHGIVQSHPIKWAKEKKHKMLITAYALSRNWPCLDNFWASWASMKQDCALSSLFIPICIFLAWVKWIKKILKMENCLTPKKSLFKCHDRQKTFLIITLSKIVPIYSCNKSSHTQLIRTDMNLSWRGII